MTSRKPTNSKSPSGRFVVATGATPDAARDPLQRLLHEAKLGQGVPSQAQLQRMQLRFVVAANNLGPHGTNAHALPQGSPWTTSGRLIPWFGAGLAAVGVSLLLLARAPAPSAPAAPSTDPSALAVEQTQIRTAAATTAQRITPHATAEVSGSAAESTAKDASKAERPKVNATTERATTERATTERATTERDALLQGLRELEAAEQSLRAGRFDAARRHLAKEVPQALTLHRSALRAMLACETGNVASGHELLAAHTKAFPMSPYLARMRATCR